jgi:hypothetical protein
MKKQLLYAALLLSSVSQAQSLTQTNEPVIGNTKLMYTCDTLTSPLATTVGSGVTWDYSQILGLSGQTQTIEIIDPATTANAASFPSSTKAFSIQGSLTNYFNSTATERVSQGFVYEEPNFGTVLAVFDTDEQTTIQYPFANGDFFTDVFSGQLSFDFNGLPQNPTCTGVSDATIDGQGTLLLPSSTSISNVIRYKITDTVFTQIVFVIPMDIEFIRTQYEYYDVANNSLPIFTHSTVKIQQAGATTPLMSQTIVLSSVQPSQNVGLEEKTSSFSVYPNPSEGIVNFKGDFAADAAAMIFDNAGRQVKSIESLSNGQSIDLSSLNKGIYLVVINNNGTQTTQSITLR